MIYLYRQTVSTDTPYKSVVVARLDIIVSVTRFISCFCVTCLSTLVEQFPLELVINYNLSKYYYSHPSANAFFVAGRKPRYVKFALCES